MIKLYAYLVNSHPEVTKPKITISSTKMDHVWLRVGEFELDERGLIPDVTPEMLEQAHEYEREQQRAHYQSLADKAGKS